MTSSPQPGNIPVEVLMMQTLFLFVISLLVASCQSVPKCGPEKRAAFDLGSGSTKMKIAEVNTCNNTLMAILSEEQVKVDFKDSLDKSPDQQFPPGVMEEGIGALKKLKEVALQKEVKRFAGVATAAFRKAKNSPEYMQRINKELGIGIHVISQNEEALLGFQAAAITAQVPPENLVSWDIGGGSQQIVALDSQPKPVIYLGQLASVNFKNQIIEKIQKKNPKTVASPNPLKKKEIDQAILLASQEAKSTVPSEIQHKVSHSSQVTVYGIGSVFNKSITRQVGSHAEVSLDMIEKALRQRTGLSDEDLKDPYAATDVTNLALVYSFMKTLHIQSYKPIDIGLADGMWFQESYWH